MAANMLPRLIRQCRLTSRSYQHATVLTNRLQQLYITSSHQTQEINRNPHNLRMQGKQQNKKGFQTEVNINKYILRLRLVISGRYVAAEIDQPDGSVILQAKTNEWHLERNLYSTCDKNAYKVLGKTIAKRMKQSGIYAVYWDIQEKTYHGRVKCFIDAVREAGISLKESQPNITPC
eukprot:m.316452 g.316452  ORF g.316452 m.316452 type:complete len:177 (+) comp16503_c0_seq9:2780-3310(+)